MFEGKSLGVGRILEHLIETAGRIPQFLQFFWRALFFACWLIRTNQICNSLSEIALPLGSVVTHIVPGLD